MRQSSKSIAPPPLHAISLHVQPKPGPILNVGVEPVVSHHSPLEFARLMNGIDQTTGRSAVESRLSASAPTSELSGFQCNRFAVSVSSATLLLLTQILVCCIDRLKPQHKVLIHHLELSATKLL